MLTPSGKGRFEGESGYTPPERINSNDPTEKEIASAHKILAQVLARPNIPRNYADNLQDIVKWWGRMELLFNMYKPNTLTKKQVFINIVTFNWSALAKSQLSETQYQRITDEITANIATIRLLLKVGTEDVGIKKYHAKVVADALVVAEAMGIDLTDAKEKEEEEIIR